MKRSWDFATGGSNSKEFWQTPQMMAEAVLQPEHSLETHEICTQYNVLKIARALFMWTGDVRYSDFYERALLNGILGVSRLTADQVKVCFS
ncbi:ShKT domain-containing protein, partial [Haematococcus lacustris]